MSNVEKTRRSDGLVLETGLASRRCQGERRQLSHWVCDGAPTQTIQDRTFLTLKAVVPSNHPVWNEVLAQNFERTTPLVRNRLTPMNIMYKLYSGMNTCTGLTVSLIAAIAAA